MNSMPVITSLLLTGGGHPGRTLVTVEMTSEADGLPVTLSATLHVRGATQLTVQQVEEQVLALLAKAIAPHTLP